jgi:hypothetical protein
MFRDPKLDYTSVGWEKGVLFMKSYRIALYRLLLFLLTALLLASCVAAPVGGLGHCSRGLCVRLSADEPMRYGQPVSLTVLVTTDQNQFVNVSLYIPKNFIIKQPNNPNDTAIDQLTRPNYTWNALPTRANVPTALNFKTVFSNDDVYQVVVYAETKGVITTDELRISYSKDGISLVTPTP